MRDIKLTEEQQQLVLDNYNLIYSCLRRLNTVGEDYQSVAALALCKAAGTFDPTKGFTFSTYACSVINNDLKAEFRHNDKIAKLPAISLSTEVILSDETIGTIEDTIGIVDSKLESSELAMDITSRIKRLNIQELEVLYYYILGYTQSDMVSLMNVTRQRISIIAMRLKNKLRGNGYTKPNIKESDKEKADMLTNKILGVIHKM